MAEVITVRRWFRLLRRAAWEGGVPQIGMWFRNQDTPTEWTTPPLSPRVWIMDMKDLQQVIEGEIPEHPERAIRRKMSLWGIVN